MSAISLKKKTLKNSASIAACADDYKKLMNTDGRYCKCQGRIRIQQHDHLVQKGETALYGNREAASLKAILKSGWPYLFLICLRLTDWRSL